jgi:hypothetical protein
MILTHLSTRDLARSLTVSKHWRDVILDPRSKELRRILFLEPSQAREYLLYSIDTDPKCYKDGSRKWQPTIVHEPSLGSKQIVEIHPALLPAHGFTLLEGMFSAALRCDQIRSVPHSTFLFQPPFEVIIFAANGTLWSHRKTGGVTFDSRFEDLAMQKLKSTFRIVAMNRTVPAAEDVKIARTAQAVK